MGEYTDREIEMLARFAHEQSGDDVPWSNLRNERKADMRAYAREKVDERGMFSHIIRAAARLMREAREQGAAEMRERAAAHIETSCEGAYQGAREIRSLPLAVTQ